VAILAELTDRVYSRWFESRDGVVDPRTGAGSAEGNQLGECSVTEYRRKAPR
jgi:hypothetical protein